MSAKDDDEPREPRCADCDDTGIKPVTRDGVEYGVHCDCKRHALLQRRVAKIAGGIPLKFAGASFGRYPLSDIDAESRKRLEAYAKDLPRRVRAGKGLWIGGAAGAGKTSAAWMLLRLAREQDFTASLYTVPDLLLDVSYTWSDESQDHERDLTDQFADVDLLILDDMAAVAKPTVPALRTLYRIVDRRYSAEKATIITTDVDADRLASLISARTVRRLKDMTGKPLFLEQTASASTAAAA